MWKGGDPDAGAGLVVLPAVIGTGDVPVLDPAQRESGSAMYAEISQGDHLGIGAEENQPLAQKLYRRRLLAHFVDLGHWVPIVSEAWRHCIPFWVRVLNG